MKPEITFEPGLQAHSVRRLTLEDIGAIQGLFEKCLDYMLLVDGHAADPQAVAEEFQSVPPGKSLEDKFVFGIFDRQGDLAGLLDTLRGFPEENTWWIDTLLLAPEARGQGLGRLIVQGFAETIQASGARALMLGVVEENRGAYRFWTRMGFAWVRQTGPQAFGNKTQTVSILRRDLGALGEQL